MYECESVEEFKALTGYTFHGMVHPDDRARIQASIDSQIDGHYGKYDHVEYRILTARGAVKWIDDYGHFSYSEDYGDIFYVFLFDVTEKILAQQAKSRFYFNMSHQLLTPMNAVSTNIKLALSHKDDPAKMVGFLEQANAAADHMIERIDEMVEVHRAPMSATHALTPKKERAEVRVLIAEDNELNRLMLKTILEDAGFSVFEAEDGRVATDMLCERGAGYFDIVLMDIQMPNLNGYEATRAIRALPGADKESLPILAISANSRDEDVALSLACGMNDHMPKPYDPDRIIEAVLRYTAS